MIPSKETSAETQALGAGSNALNNGGLTRAAEVWPTQVGAWDTTPAWR